MADRISSGYRSKDLSGDRYATSPFLSQDTAGCKRVRKGDIAIGLHFSRHQGIRNRYDRNVTSLIWATSGIGYASVGAFSEAAGSLEITKWGGEKEGGIGGEFLLLSET